MRTRTKLNLSGRLRSTEFATKDFQLRPIADRNINLSMYSAEM